MKSESFAPNEQVQTQQSPGLFPVLEATVGGIIKHVVKSSKVDKWKGIDLGCFVDLYSCFEADNSCSIVEKGC